MLKTYQYLLFDLSSVDNIVVARGGQRGHGPPNCWKI